MKKIIKLIPLMLILVLALTSCQKNAENSGKPKVYTSFYAMYNFAKTIGGDDIDLTNIVPTGTEPHDFEPTASDMAKLSEADIFIYNGGQNNRNTSAERKSYMHIGTDTDRRKRSAYLA